MLSLFVWESEFDTIAFQVFEGRRSFTKFTLRAFVVCVCVCVCVCVWCVCGCVGVCVCVVCVVCVCVCVCVWTWERKSVERKACLCMTERTFSVPLCVLVCPCQYGGGLTLPYLMTWRDESVLIESISLLLGPCVNSRQPITVVINNR